MSKVRIGGAAADQPVKLFSVFNTAHRNLMVLATSRDDAVQIAHGANHVHFIWDRKDKNYPNAAEVCDPHNDRQLAYHVDLLEAAIAQGLRGTVHLDGEHLYVGHCIVQVR